MTSQNTESSVIQLHFPTAATADICDANPDARVLISWFRSFGGKARCAGPIEIVATRDDNSLVKAVLSEPGARRVLLIDNQASCNYAMLGGNLAKQAVDNDWAGIVVNGAVRDTDELSDIPLGIFALATCPRRSVNRSIGRRAQATRVGTERILPGEFLVADTDGVVVLGRTTATGETR